jgi:hypothetical protein
MSRRILITNNTLSGRAGTELYVRDVASELLARGHQVVAYSSILGEVAEEIRAATIPVVDRLDAVSVPPHVIHGHHHLETMTALLHYPEVPAIYFCHGWLPTEEMPPKFPRILRYVAVDRTCRDRLIDENGIPPERVHLLLNFVDLKRFKPRGPLPEKPARALVLSNSATESSSLPAIREACARFDISLDAVGQAVRNATRCPESLLPHYDLVFAKGRAALEALAVGAAVIPCDTVGVGPMVTPHNMEMLRQLNFGIRALRNRIDVETIAAEFALYNATQAAEVSDWVRRNAGLNGAVDQLIELYEAVIEEHRQSATVNAAQEMQAASAYLRHWVPNLTLQRQANLQHELLSRDYQSLRQAYEATRTERRQLQESSEQLFREIDALKAVTAQLEAERNRARLDLAEARSSSTMRLRNRLVDLPLIGSWMKALGRLAAARLCK